MKRLILVLTMLISTCAVRAPTPPNSDDEAQCVLEECLADDLFLRPEKVYCAEDGCRDCQEDGDCQDGEVCEAAGRCAPAPELEPCESHEDCLAHGSQFGSLTCFEGGCWWCGEGAATCPEDYFCFEKLCVAESNADPSCFDKTCSGECKPTTDRVVCVME